MQTNRAWFLRRVGIFNKRHDDRELDPELEGHLQFHIDNNLTTGPSPEEARREVRMRGFQACREAVRPYAGAAWFAILLMMPTTATPKSPTALSTCTFAGDSAVTGSCGRLFDQTPEITLRPAHSAVGVVWRTDSSPSTLWYGDMTDQGYPNAPIQLEIYAASSGILQTIYGWFPVTEYRTTPSGIAFEVDGLHEVSPNALDAQIIRRAAEILSSPAVWNRADNRKCAPDAAKWSIYCAGVQAVEEVTGGTGEGHGIDHRRPALEVIRGVVDDRSKGRSYDHDLMDYNNDPTTTFVDMQSLFSEALQSTSDSTWLAAHGFSAK